MFFFFNDTATTEIYTLSLHDALPIYGRPCSLRRAVLQGLVGRAAPRQSRSQAGSPREQHVPVRGERRSEEHTSELQSRQYLVCRLLLEKKKYNLHIISYYSFHLFLIR